MPLDKDVQILVEQMNSLGFPRLGSIPITELRSVFESFTAALPPGPSVQDVEDRSIKSGGTEIQIRIYRPSENPRAILVYYHGGAWCSGSLNVYDSILRNCANYTGMAIVSVDYRLAPEHPFPAAVDDAYAATLWVAQNRHLVTTEEKPLFIGGDSAGGNLAAVVAQKLRDDGGPELAGQILIYPATLGDIDAEYLEAFEPPLLFKSDITYSFDQYVPNKSLRRDPRFAPIRAKNLSGLAPALVLTAEYDLLKEDGVQYAQALEKAGCTVVRKHYDGAIHGFFSSSADLGCTKQALSDIANFVNAIS
jgi:acetyl esterase